MKDELDGLSDEALEEVFNNEVSHLSTYGGHVPPPPFARDTDAVLKYLEKWSDVSIDRVDGDGWQVAIMRYEKTVGGTTEEIVALGWEDTLPRSICVALIKASRASRAQKP